MMLYLCAASLFIIPLYVIMPYYIPLEFYQRTEEKFSREPVTKAEFMGEMKAVLKEIQLFGRK